MKFYRFYIDAFRAETRNLSVTEIGALVSLIVHYALAERPFPLDRQVVYQTVRAILPSEKSTIDRVLAKCFVERVDGWHHLECDRQIALCNRSRKNGKKGGRPQKNRNLDETQTEPRRNPGGTQTITQMPGTEF